MRKKIELDAYKQKMVKEKIKGLIYEHAYQYNNLRNEVPEILTDHPALLKT